MKALSTIVILLTLAVSAHCQKTNYHAIYDRDDSMFVWQGYQCEGLLYFGEYMMNHLFNGGNGYRVYQCNVDSLIDLVPTNAVWWEERRKAIAIHYDRINRITFPVDMDWLKLGGILSIKSPVPLNVDSLASVESMLRRDD